MRKLTCVTMATTLALFFLCSCTPKENSSTTDPGVQAQTTAGSTISDGLTQQTIETQITEEESTSDDVTTTAQAVSLEIPFTKAEIVGMFNAAANKVKLEKRGYIVTEKSNADEKNIILSDNVPKQLPIAKFIALAINKTSKDPVTIKKGENHDEFPVKGQTWASKLEPSALKNATCVDKGDFYEIELKFKNEKLTALPDVSEKTAHGKAFSVLLDKEFRDAFGGFNALGVRVDIQKFVPEYKNSSIKCKVNKTGRMIGATYYLNTVSMVETSVEVMNKSHVIEIQMEYSVTNEYVFN